MNKNNFEIKEKLSKINMDVLKVLFNLIFQIWIISDVQVSCIKHVDHYIPPLWVMCLESVAHLLVMLNFSSNFLIYCSVSNQFKLALSKVCFIFCKSPSTASEASEYHSLVTNAVLPCPSTRAESPSQEMMEISNGHDKAVKTQIVLETFTITEDSEEMKICRVWVLLEFSPFQPRNTLFPVNILRDWFSSHQKLNLKMHLELFRFVVTDENKCKCYITERFSPF